MFVTSNKFSLNGRGSIKLATLPVLAPYHLLAPLQKFKNQSPNLNLSIQELEEEYERIANMGCCDEIDNHLEEIQRRIDGLYNSEVIVPVNNLAIYNRKRYVYTDIIAELKEANANADEAYKKFEKYFNKKLRYK